VQYSRLLQADIRWVALGHLNYENSERPDVDFSVVLLFAADHFGGHPAHSTYLTGSHGIGGVQLHRVTEVSKLYFARFGAQDVVRLDVSVKDVAVVAKLKCQDCLVANVLYEILRVISGQLLQHWCESTTVHQLHEHP